MYSVTGCRADARGLSAWLKRIAFCGAAACAAIDSAGAADAPVLKARVAAPASYDWTGFYLGGHFGYGSGSLGRDVNAVPNAGVIFPSSVTGLIGGYQIGYNAHLPNNVVIGWEADVTFASPIVGSATLPTPFNTDFEYAGTARGRIGYASGRILPYVTGGVAWAQTKADTIDVNGDLISSASRLHWGWTAGVGVEYALTGRWTAKLEYNYIDLGARTYALDVVPPTVAVDPHLHLVKLGLNYRLSDAAPWDAPSAAALKRISVPDDDDWSVHGQTTFLAQGYGSFRSPYQGTNSLPGTGQGRETWTANIFVGRRLWEGGELYLNPELDQGFGLNRTLGLAGFSNGEAQKGGAPYPRFRMQRYFFRQTFGLGGEQETVEDGPNQLAGKRDIDRVTLTVGRIAIGDIFDANSYAHDPRADFMNWSMWSSIAYDFPADLPGFTRGAVAELNRKDWTLRAGLFQVPQQPNSDVLTFKTGGAVVEWEQRYSIFEQGGKLRVGAFANRGNTANYRQTTAIAAADPATDINTVVDNTRRIRSKNGFYVNAEQAITKDVGVFGRVSWNDGQNEILSFTDVDRSVSGGVSVKGVSWGRANDTFGLGGAVNGLSGAHRDFLAAGGLGLLIGDGRLNYRPEKILETYYAISLAKWSTLTFDYQFINNPAYNADRGPVSLFAMRYHAEW